uniref:CSON002118 protein n=1 Tax=Culicoides sonorensis TaxID=179676 RepID=A0A336LRK8_CULSO
MQKIIIILFFGSHHLLLARCLDCELIGNLCTFTGVETTAEMQYFYPSATQKDDVERVQFKNSRIYNLTDELCQTFPNLSDIRIINVSLEVVAPNALHQCKNLRSLHISYNNLTKLTAKIFSENKELNSVILQHNQLKSIDGGIFDNLNSLRVLGLPENDLSEFPLYQFPVLENLEDLFIFENDLTDLDEQELLLKFPNLKNIYIHNNVFDCDRLQVIINAFKRRGIAIRHWENKNVLKNSGLQVIENVECMTKDEHVTQIIKSGLINSIDLRKRLGIVDLENEVHSIKCDQSDKKGTDLINMKKYCKLEALKNFYCNAQDNHYSSQSEAEHYYAQIQYNN